MRAWLLAMCVLETVMRPSLFPGRLCMRQLIGSVLLLAAVGLGPAELAAQRRPAARSAASRADRPSFGVQLNWIRDYDFGIGGRRVFPLQSLLPKTPIDGIVSFDYFFPSAPRLAGKSVGVRRSSSRVASASDPAVRRGPSTLWAGRVAFWGAGTMAAGVGTCLTTTPKPRQGDEHAT